MREILFRAQRKNMWERLGRWVYGCGAEQRNFGCETVEGTVGQFTGLLDKNGVKIFEGDVARDEVTVFKVEFEYACWHFVRVSGTYQYPAFYSNAKRIEVIGNVHDNPELLKAEE